jgi:non-ribosomal peptide synthetase component F
VGFFNQTIVIRCRIAGTNSFNQLLGQVREQVLDGLAHQYTPFQEIVRRLSPHREKARNPLFQVFFNLLDLPVDDADWGDLRVTPLALPEGGARFDFTLYLRPKNGSLLLDLHYNRARYAPERAAALLDQYKYLLQQITAAPEQPLPHYRLTSEPENLERRIRNPKVFEKETIQDRFLATAAR